MVRRFTILIGLVLLLTACETAKPVPDGYNGPLAKITDTVAPFSTSGADIFYLARLNGKTIHNSFTATGSATQGRGFQMRTVAVARDIPASPITLTIVGRRDYAAPIQTLVNKIYLVSGDLEFAPSPDETYVVKGQLGESGSAVWLENEKTGVVVGRKFEVDGSATLGFFEK
jgi:hypothetical protein